MGCCQSSTSLPEKENYRPALDSKGGAGDGEAVKEVLSETPVVKGYTENVEEKNDGIQEMKVESRDVIKQKHNEEIVSEASVVSDLGSYTESFSTATTGLENRDEEDGEVNQRVPARVPRRRQNAVDISGGRVRRDRLAPARRTATAKENRGQVAVSRQAQGRVLMAHKWNIGTETGPRRDSGESSRMRSRSPATRGEVGRRRGNLRSKSPGVSETVPLPPGGAVLVKTAESGSDSKVEKSDDDVPPEDGESLENPIVSLECFIFL